MAQTIIEFEGVYGGSQSREIVLRVLKEALALVENTEAEARLICSGFHIEEERPEEGSVGRDA
ncbi:MAG: hypothetical protein ACRDIB_02440 [Ardenticatenaceae bacterium]